jgi:ABC-type dipeptide/oligopeptide/nickel transport system ATPase component
MPEVLLEVRDLRVNFYTYAGVVKALDGIGFNVYKGEAFGLVGETGCGKSVTAAS